MLGDFNARVGRSVQIDDVIGMFGEDMRNASGNRLLSFLNEVELMICNGRKLVSEPEWTRVRPSLKQKSIIDQGFIQDFLLGGEEVIVKGSASMRKHGHTRVSVRAT